MFDNQHNLIEWYFDISKNIGIENGIPFEDDLYLDMIMMPTGEEIVVDEEELLKAFHQGDISQEDVDCAYQTLSYLENTYVNHLEELVKFTNHLSERFKSKIKYYNVGKEFEI